MASLASSRRVALERPGDDDGQPAERLLRPTRRARRPCGPRRRPTGRRSRGASRPAVEPVAHGLGDDPAHALDAGELLDAGLADRGHRAEVLGEGPRGRRPDVPDRERRRGPATAAGLGADSRLATSLAPLAERTRPSTTASSGSVFLAARVKSGTRAHVVGGETEERRTRRSSTPDSSRATEPSQPRASMSKAPRPARPDSRSRSCAGQVRRWGSGCPCRPPSRAPAGCRRRGSRWA